MTHRSTDVLVIGAGGAGMPLVRDLVAEIAPSFERLREP